MRFFRMISTKNNSNSLSTKNEYEKLNGKYISKTSNGKYIIIKTFNYKAYYFGSFDNFQDAMERRDYLIAHDWVEPIEKLSEEDLIKNYYKHVQIRYNKYYIVNSPGNKGSKYLGTCNSIEEALLFRDLAEDNDWIINKPEVYDLITDNPYISEGLKYPIPDRLIPKDIAETKYGKGSILKKGPQSYHIRYGSKYICACRTYEYAYYIKQEMNKVNWDLDYLDEIKAGYSEWYTWLLNFYLYIIPNKQKGSGWLFIITPKNNPNGKLEQIRFNNLEDALWERDLYIKYDFDIESIVYGADDRNNPYYDMELPPYPERSIKNVSNNKKKFDKLLLQIKDTILDGVVSQKEVSDILGITDLSIRNLMRKYNVTWKDFKNICLSGEDPLSVLEYNKVFTPDLSVHYSKQNYISKVKGRGNPYTITHRGVYFGGYPTRRMANKVVSLLRKCGWDKSKLKDIQNRVGFKSVMGSKRWVYPIKYKGKVMSYTVRKKDKNKKIHNFGNYKLKEKAEYVRDRLVEVDWVDDAYPGIRADADRLFPDEVNLGDKYIHHVSRRYRVFKDNTVFGWFDDYLMARVFRDLMVGEDWCLDCVGDVFCRMLGCFDLVYVLSLL